jgi:hypothetical protein
MEGEGNVLQRGNLDPEQASDSIRTIGQLDVGMRGIARRNVGTIISSGGARLDFQGTHTRDGITEANLQVQLNVQRVPGRRLHLITKPAWAGFKTAEEGIAIIKS